MKVKKCSVEFLKYLGVLLLYFFVTFISTFVSTFIFIILKMPEVAGDISKIDLMSFLQDGNFQMLTLAISGIITIIIMIATKNGRNRFSHTLGLKDFLIYFMFGLGINVILSLVLDFFLPTDLISQSNESINILFSGNNWLAMITSIIIVPIAEECIFRGWLLSNKFPYTVKSLAKDVELETLKDDRVCFAVAVIIQGVLFGIMHGNLVQGIYTCALGIFFAYVNDSEKSLMPSILMHSGLNFFAAISKYTFSDAIIYAMMVFGILGIILFFANYKKQE